jgi:3D (Asp-Asp-Asp) domain-containing protein
MAIVRLLALDGIEAKVVRLDVSAYDLQGITASGEPVRDGIAACGPSIPFGTVAIFDDGIQVCKDRGRLITDSHWDRWMPAGAIRFGRRNMVALMVF